MKIRQNLSESMDTLAPELGPTCRYGDVTSFVGGLAHALAARGG